MNTDLLRPVLTGSAAVEQFAYYFMSSYELDEFYPEVRKCLVGDCPVISRLADDLYDELLYSLLSEVDFLDFLVSLDNEYKVGVLTFNGMTAVNDTVDNDRLLSLLKNLGEEKVVKTLCTDAFMSGDSCF